MNPRLPATTIKFDNCILVYNKENSFYVKEIDDPENLTRVTGYFEEFPGNCAIAIIHDVYTNSLTIKLETVIKKILEYLTEREYTKVYYTTNNSQTRVRKALESLGFTKEAENFTSVRTLSTIYTHSIFLNKVEYNDEDKEVEDAD